MYIGNPDSMVEERRLVSPPNVPGLSATKSHANESMGLMGAALAHEMNQPLTAIVIYLETLIKVVNTTASGELASSLASKALKEAERATDIMRKMRRFSATPEIEAKSVNLNNLVVEALDELGAQFLDTIEVVTDFDTKLSLVQCDPGLIRQVLINLLRNASEALAEKSDPQITVITRMRDGTAQITVSDNGSGISEALAGRLFNAFATTKKQGIGLGLAISRMIVQNNGGDLQLVQSAGGLGASFCISLPVK